MSHAYSEDQLVEQPAIGLFEDLAWETVSAELLPQLAPFLPPK
jgi:hypothetical protein